MLSLNQTSTGTWQITYNGANRPIRFRNEETDTTVDCGYDSQGRRYFKKVTVAGTVTLHHRYIYRGYLQIAAVDCTRSGHLALWLVTWDPSQPTATRPLAIQKDGNWFTYGYDITKNICEVFGPAGYIRTAYSYAPFGSVSASGDVSQPFQWSSEVYDSELDLIYYNYLHYSPALGRFLSRDPIQEQGGLNLYAFVGNTPLVIWDKLGRSMIAPGAEVWNPLRPPEHVYYPSYPESICDGYNPESDSKCCRDGKLVNDPYPKAAFTVCQQFVRIYNGSFLAENMACVAKCLIKLEGSIANKPDCRSKNNARMNAHLDCYRSCKFAPLFLPYL